MGDSKSEAYSFRVYSSTVTVRYTGERSSSVIVKRADKILAEFKMKGSEIVGPVYEEYGTNNQVIMTDSIDPERGKQQKTYHGFFTSNHVTSSTIYYSGKRPGFPTRRKVY